MVLAHGAGAPHDHTHMTCIADRLADHGIGTLRFNFPFMESGKRRVDNPAVCQQTIAAALTRASELEPESTLLLAGHSFGGRMATHYLADHPDAAKAMICYSFPLHVAKKPDTKRAVHLPQLTLPTLFVSGDRDALADRSLMEGVVSAMPDASLHWLETADHSYKILKRSRQSEEDVYVEAARVTAIWLAKL